MKKIELHNVVPNIFASREDISSDIWRADFSFERGKTYLVEAASGTGKSSLCSYLFGQRGDYQGDILFDGKDIRQYSSNDWSRIRRKLIKEFQVLK